MEDKRGSIHLGGKQDVARKSVEMRDHEVDMDASQEAKAGSTAYEGEVNLAPIPLDLITVPLEEKDPMTKWKKLKQNNFLSSSHIGAIPIPKRRGRKSKTDMLKKKMEELANREKQVDRFTKIAPPSELLNELNPGILHHVRNRKQVHSIIEAFIIRSEKYDENSSIRSSSSTTLSNEEPSNFTIVSSLSLKAATVASKWMELQRQDIERRLLALRRSRRRVRSVITTELPFLISKEFGNNQENDPHAMKTEDLHLARWTSLFDQFDEALSEEVKKLKTSLNQVKAMQLLCDQGLNVSGVSSALDSWKNELAVNAAAASIYSTCNFILSALDFGIELDPNSNSKS